MAQNITLMGASYPDVPAVELPKTGGGTATFTDTSDADASASEILTGKKAYVNGALLTGTLSVPEQNTWYGTCTTGATTQARVVTTTTGDFVLAEGNMVRVKFTSQNNTEASTLNVDGTGAKNIARVGTTTATRYFWSAGEVIDFVYDGTNFVMSRTGVASTTYYGLVKLSDATNSSSTSLSATANAVKKTYDLAKGKMTKISSPTANSILVDDGNGEAVDSGTSVNDLKVLVVTSSAFSSLPQTISNSSITADHVVINSVLSNQAAQWDDWTVTTSNGSVSINGSISGSTTLTLYLAKGV